MILCLCPNPAIDKFVWVDDFKTGTTNRIKKEKSFPGGKGVHVALGIAELGDPCGLLGFWGGHQGRYIKQYCESKGIACYGPEVAENNRTCITLRANGELDGTELLGPGPFIDAERSEFFWLEYANLLDGSSAVCMSGSWPPSNTEMEYSRYVVEAKNWGIRTFIDCSGKKLKSALNAKPYCIHINQQEGLDFFHEHLPQKISYALLKNCDMTAVTCGADGLYLSAKNYSTLHANCTLKNIISSVGSGDALMAALVVADKRNLSFSETAQLAVACGAANCIRKDLGMFDKNDVDRLFKQVELMPVDPAFCT